MRSWAKCGESKLPWLQTEDINMAILHLSRAGRNLLALLVPSLAAEGVRSWLELHLRTEDSAMFNIGHV